MAHEPQATDATAGIASEINHKSRTREIRNRAADVPGDVDSKDAREHADAHIADIRIELARTDNLVGHHDRPLLLTRAWNCERRPHRRAISLAHRERVGLAEPERDCSRRNQFLIVHRYQDVARLDANRSGDTAGMDVLKHPAFTVFSRIRLRQRRGHRDSPG